VLEGGLHEERGRKHIQHGGAWASEWKVLICEMIKTVVLIRDFITPPSFALKQIVSEKSETIQRKCELSRKHVCKRQAF